MSVSYSDIGDRLRAFRLGSGLSADEIARKVGISRTALYRFEKGEVVKIETLAGLADLLGVSLPTLLGVEMEYIASALTYFERTRQLEQSAERIIVLAGPISFLLASDDFERSLEEVLIESVPDTAADREKLLGDIHKIVGLLHDRKRIYRQRRPAVVNLMSALSIERMLRSGLIGRPFVSEKDIVKRKARARQEVEHFITLLEEEPMGVQIGLATDAVPHTGFQIFKAGDRQTLTISPFRLGEQPNVRLGVAMVTSSREALDLHEKIVGEIWRTALKGRDAAEYLKKLVSTTS